MRRLIALVCLALCATGCDFTPALDIETPAYAPAIVVRSVLAAGRPATVRITISGDPAVSPVPAADRIPSATPAGATVTLLRDGRVVEALVPRRQTCAVSRTSRCNPETGRTDTEESGTYNCSAFGGAVPIEAGATYTIHVEVPGLPSAEATVTVPRPAEIVADEEPSGDAGTRRFRVRVRDLPGAGTRFGLSLFRDYGAYMTQVCRRGGPRDTLVVLGAPWRFQGRFATSDPVLLADARSPAASYPFATFTDATFMDGEASLVLRSDPAAPDNVVPTDGYALQVAVLSPTLYEAYLTASVLFGEDNPFAEPTDLPGNVVGGYGLVGAVAFSNVAVPPRRGL